LSGLLLIAFDTVSYSKNGREVIDSCSSLFRLLFEKAEPITLEGDKAPETADSFDIDRSM